MSIPESALAIPFRYKWSPIAAFQCSLFRNVSLTLFIVTNLLSSNSANLQSTPPHQLNQLLHKIEVVYPFSNGITGTVQLRESLLTPHTHIPSSRLEYLPPLSA